MQSLPFSINAGTTTLVTGVPGYFIEIYCLFSRMGALSTLTLKSDTTSLAGPMSFAASGGSFDIPMASQAIFRCGLGEDFNLTLSGLTSSCGGVLFYDLTL